MPIDPSVYQYCEAQDIPVDYLDELEQPKPSASSWKTFVKIVFLLVIGIPAILSFFALFIISGIIVLGKNVVESGEVPEYQGT